RTQPDRLAALGRLFGLDAPAPSRARVLELGCASGGNLLPLAERAPEASFVGVDLSAAQISAGLALRDAVGLDNVELRHGDILDVDASWGAFDYVICHGVYSWVPPAVQDRILAICRDRLTEHGVAYISYNTYPGWHAREMVRNMMRWHVRGLTDPAQRIGQSRALIDFLAGAVSDQASGYGAMLTRELELLSRAGDDYLFHEHLEECNAPVYFHEFADRIDHHGLQYLCESDVHMMLARDLPQGVRETLDRIAPDLVRMEQYVDFVRNRQFRASLVCRRERPLVRALGPGSLAGLRLGFAGATTSSVTCDLTPEVECSFETEAGICVRSSQPITKAALSVLHSLWPADLGFDELWQRAASSLAAAGLRAGDPAASRARLGGDLLDCLLGGGAVEVRCEPPVLVPAAGARPRIPAGARWLAGHQGWVPTGRHQTLELDRFGVEVVLACDGTRDRDAVQQELAAAIDAGRLTLPEGDGPATPAELRARLSSMIAQALDALARCGAFVA
ncbi:MAG: class I SAM-dependent methyltransferase, partial [Myxococcales bacterium]|nr:class I SAM-dependent methyltransferase [Myxococcales bacterium]